MIDRLIDQKGGELTEDEEDYMSVLGDQIERYEDIHWPMPSEIEEQSRAT